MLFFEIRDYFIKNIFNTNKFLFSVPSSVHNNNNNYYNYKTTPSAPKLGGSFGTYYNGKGNFNSRKTLN